MLNDAIYICLWQYNKDIYSPTFSLGPLRVFLYSGYADNNKNIVARGMTTGIVSLKKSMSSKRRGKDFWFRLKRMSSFSIFLKKFTR
jgi:hypothetical protein